MPGVFAVWVAAGLIAAGYCWFRHPTDAIVEMMTYARFLAGITVYPQGNPVAYGMAATITPIHGVLALLTAAGVSDRFLSLILNMLTSALYAQAFALLCLGLTRKPLLSLAAGLAPVLAWAFVEGADYPINTVNGPVLGNIAFALMLNALGLAGCNRPIWSVAMVTVLAMMHPVYGAFAAALGLGSLLGPRLWPGRLVAVMDGRALALGAVAVAAAWASARGLRPSFPPLPPVEPMWVEAYLDKWDYHRNVAVDARTLGIAAQALLATILAALLAWRAPARLGPAGTTLAVLLAVGGAIGCVAWGLFHALREVLPPLLVLPMPNRFLNLPEAAALALTIAASLAIRPRWGQVAALGALALMALFSAAATMGGWLPVPEIKGLERVVLIAVELAAVVALLRYGEDRAERLSPLAEMLETRPLRLAAFAAVAAAIVLLPREPNWSRWCPGPVG